MKTIELKEYETNDLIRNLEYAKNKKLEEYKMGKINLSQSRYEIDIIEDLISKISTKSYNKKTGVDRDLLRF